MFFAVFKGFVREQALANIIRNDINWTRTYIAYREFGASSLFGETSLSGLTIIQSELLSLSQLYDVIQSQYDVSDAVPVNLWEYPTKLSKWYSDFAEKRRKGTDKKKDNEYSTEFRSDMKSDMAGYAAVAQAGVQNSTDWALEYLKKQNQVKKN